MKVMKTKTVKKTTKARGKKTSAAKEVERKTVRLARSANVPVTAAMLGEVQDHLSRRMDSRFESLKSEIHGFRVDVKTEMHELRTEMHGIRDDLRAEMHAIRDELRAEMYAIRDELRAEMHAIRDELRAEMYAIRDELRTEMYAIRDELKAEMKAGREADRKWLKELIEEGWKVYYHSTQSDIQSIKAELHRVALLVEEQNARNIFVLDGLTALSDRQDRLEKLVSRDREA